MIPLGALVLVACLLGLTVLFRFIGRGYATGRLQPNMGHLNKNNTGEAWLIFRSIVAVWFLRAAWCCAVGIVLVVGAALVFDRDFYAPIGVGALVVSSTLMIFGTIRGSNQAELKAVSWPVN